MFLWGCCSELDDVPYGGLAFALTESQERENMRLCFVPKTLCPLTFILTCIPYISSRTYYSVFLYALLVARVQDCSFIKGLQQLRTILYIKSCYKTKAKKWLGNIPFAVYFLKCLSRSKIVIEGFSPIKTTKTLFQISKKKHM